MEWTVIVEKLFEFVLIPLIFWLGKVVINFINAKIKQAQDKTKSELGDKWLGILGEVVTDCVNATNQTYVNSLKQQGAFDADAQKVAFKMTFDAVMDTLSDNGKEALGEVVKDLPKFVNELIESKVKQSK